MPAILIALASMLSSIAGHLAGRVVLALGFQYVVFSGLSAGLGAIEGYMLAALGGMGLIQGIVQTLQIGTALSIVGSATAAKFMIQGVTNGTLTRLVMR